LETKFSGKHLATTENIDESTQAILSSKGHLLYLCTPGMDKHKIYSQFLANRSNAILVTFDDLERTKEILKKYKVEKLAITNPTKLAMIKDFETIIIDCTSMPPPVNEPEPKKPLKYSITHKRKKIGYGELQRFLAHGEREQLLSKLNSDVLCVYDITKLSRDDRKKIVEKHSKAILSKDSSTMITESFSTSIGNGFLEKFVKNELETLILAMVSKEPMCGIDIKKGIYENFNVLLSSGTLYPLLHKLEKEGFLHAKLGFEKARIYTAADSERISNTLNDHIQAKNFLNMFLRSSMQETERIALIYEKKE
jgi:DNA-binding PadR family transcriptional regulator